MEAAAPAALALCISLDAVSSLGLVLMSYQGPFVAAMLPLTENVRLNIAAGMAIAARFPVPPCPSLPPSLSAACTLMRVLCWLPRLLQAWATSCC